jgi:hypothetical protein
MPAAFDNLEPRERRTLGFGLGVTLAIHLVLAIVLATAGGPPDLDATAFPLARKLCDDFRCPEKALLDDRRGPDDVTGEDLGLIEATVIPALGLAKPVPGRLPELQKYEQAEKLEEAVNVDRDNDQPRPVPNQDVKPKPAEKDRRSKALAALLGAPEDDDPRKRATSLDRIVGHAEGSVYGQGSEFKAGNLYAGKVALAIRAQFTVPPFLSDADLRKLRVRIKVSKMTDKGQVQEFEILDRSSDPRFDAAAVQAVKRFVPKEGGTALLPVPDAQTLAYINGRGMVIDLDGALFRK